MQIKCSNPGTKSILVARFDRQKVVFSKNGFATVPDQVGRYIVRRYPAIEEVVKKASSTTTRSSRGVETPEE